MSVHVSLQDEAVPIRPLESEFGTPSPVVASSNCQRALLRIDIDGVSDKGIVRSLKKDPLRCVKDDTPPASVVIIRLRRPKFPINAQLVHVPDPIKRGLG